MPRATSRSRRSSSYIFKFVGTASLLVAGTLVLVLYVLPERYVLSSGFREGNLNLPNPQIPFEPAPPLRIAAIPGIPGPGDETVPGPGGDLVVPRGPAELFWERVLPLLEAERYGEAIPLFTDYLERYPGDLGVRREYAITLAAAGDPERAVPVLRELLEYEDDDELHLLLARTLRDSRRVAEASEHYSILLDRRPDDEELAVEWVQALSWAGDYARAEEVVRRALEASPESLALRAEEVRIVYYRGRLADADRLIRSFTPEELRATGLTELRDQIRRELTPPPDTTTPPPPPTLLERALQAREADDLDDAEALFRSALEESPDDVEAWRAFADFLQYEREDFLGALEALREVESRTEAPDATLQYRMAQLEIWSDQTAEARLRLEALLARFDEVESAAADPAAADADVPLPPTRADILSLLGDLDRWDGERIAAVRRYQAALEADPEHEGANDGLDVLRAEVDRFLVQTEDPGIGAVASTFADTDDFRRYQAGGAWTGLHDAWVWSTVSGGRWVEGYEPGGGVDSRQGLFAELEGGRWWRWGTVRTALRLGIQNVRSSSDPDLGVGASLRFMGSSGSRTDVQLDHEPAYGITNTLQSLTTDVRQDRLLLSHSRPLSERWTGAVTGEVASLDHGTISSQGNTRVQGGLSAARRLSPAFSAGLAARALTYADPAPSVPLALPDATAVRLYWDPELTVSLGPFLQMAQPLSSTWSLTGRFNPGVAWVRERNLGSELVPDLSGRLGLLREGSKYRTRIEFFYGQGRYSRYRSYGVDFSFSARGFFGPGFGS